MTPRFPEITVQLTGENGNVFSLAARVGRALRKAGLDEESKAFYERINQCPSYDAALQEMMATVTVE